MVEIDDQTPGWDKLDRFDKDWVFRYYRGEDMLPHRQSMLHAIYDHESCGNWDTAFILRSILPPES